MDIKEFKSLFDLIIGTVGSISTGLILSYLNKKMQNKKAPIVIAIIIVTISIISANFLAKNLINNSLSVRNLINPNNIEGYWYETSPPDTNNLIKHVTLIRINYNAGSYEIHGETFDTLGNSYANFKSSTTAFNNGVLFFQYTSYNNTHGIGQGFDQLQFSDPANDFKGFIFSMTSKRYYFMNGHRISSEQLNKYKNLRTEEYKVKFVMACIRTTISM